MYEKRRALYNIYIERFGDLLNKG